MTARRFLIAIVFVACSVPAFGQSARLPFVGRTAPQGVKVVPPGYNTMTQHMIPRYMGGVKQGTNAYESYGPAGQVMGWGPHSVIQGNAQTQNQAVKAVVFTEDYGAQNMSQWQGGTAGLPQGYAPAVLQAQVRDLTILGHDKNASNYTTITGGVDMLLDGSDLYGGLFVRSSGHTIENVTVYHIPGTAVVSTRGNSSIRHGTVRPYDREKSIVRRCQVAWAYRGFEIIGNDSIVADLEGQALRDYGIKFSTGATQISGALHFWGVGGDHGDPAAAVWFPDGAGPCWGGPIYAESSNTGMLIESAANMLHDIFSHTCWEECIKITGQRNKLSRVYVRLPTTGTQPLGIRLGGQYSSISDGHVEVQGLSGAVTDASHEMPATTIVITSEDHGLSPGNKITVSNVRGNTAANGTWTVTPADPDGAGELTIADGFELDGSTSNNRYTSGGVWVTNFVGIRLDNGTGQRLRDLTFGVGDGGTAIDVDHQLNYSVIDVTVRSGAMGIDLKEDNGTSRIGVNNTIKITTAADSPPSTKIDLPTGWQKKTPKNTTNHVEINGQRWYPPNHEF